MDKKAKTLMRNTENGKVSMVLIPLLMLLVSFFMAGLLILALGKNPLDAYRALFIGAFGSRQAVISSVNKAIPICISAFAVGICSKVGVFNIGVEGQLMMGALGAAIAGTYIKGLPSVIHIPVTLLCGMIFGALWGLLPSICFLKRGTNIVVTNILFNVISGYLLTFLINGPFLGSDPMVAATEKIEASAQLPLLIGKPNKLSIAILIMLFVAFLLYVFIYKSTYGYEFRATGLNRNASDYVGIRTGRYIFVALIISGMLAGLAGSLEITGNYYMLYDKFSPGYGYDGIPISLLAQGNPWICIAGGIIFGGLRAGSQNMQMRVGVQKEIVNVIQGLLILSIAAEPFFKYALRKWKRRCGRNDR